MKTFDEIYQIVKFLQDEHLNEGFDVFYRVDEEEVICYVNTNDLLYWGVADAEAIEREDIQLMRSCIKDIEDLSPEKSRYSLTSLVIMLFACRKNQMRPQGIMYSGIPTRYWRLFDACGDHRPSELGNPYPTPLVDWEETELLRHKLLAYPGGVCRICRNPIEKEHIGDVIFAGYSKDGTSCSAHKNCWVEDGSDSSCWKIQ